MSLSKESATCLSEKGYLPFEEVINRSSRMQDVRKASEGSDKSELSDMSEGHSKVSEGYYEVEQIVDRRINPATQAFEYLVRFKGYSECDDLWLPASSFNMPLNYVSVSSFGRKRKWRTNIDESTSEHCSESPKRKLRKTFTQKPRSSKDHQNDSKKKRPKSLASNVDITFIADQDVSFCVQGKAGEVAKLFEKDLKERSTRFCCSRADIAVQNFPKIVPISQHDVTIRSGTKDCCDPLTIQSLPPLSLYEHGAKALLKIVEKKGDNYSLRFASIGNFSRESLPILHNYYVLKDIRNKFKEEKAFLEKRLSGISEKDKETLVNAILYRRTATPALLARRNGIDLSVDQVTCLIGERYLTDNVINYLMSIFVEEGKTLSGKNTCLAADSILLCCSERIIGSSVRNPCFGKNVTQLTTILLPTHLKENSHWGLCKIEVPAKSVFFDDGFYMKPPKQLDVVVKAVLRTLYSLSKSDIFDLHAWEPL